MRQLEAGRIAINSTLTLQAAAEMLQEWFEVGEVSRKRNTHSQSTEAFSVAIINALIKHGFKPERDEVEEPESDEVEEPETYEVEELEMDEVEELEMDEVEEPESDEVEELENN